MTDIVSKAIRSRMMSGIRAKNTKPELLVRSGLHRLGFRFGLHHSGMPGKPDLVLRRYGAVVFVHGCFWHGHECHLFVWPKTRPSFWRRKILGNRCVDETCQRKLSAQGWRVLVVWECALKGANDRKSALVLAGIAAWIRSKRRFGTVPRVSRKRC